MQKVGALPRELGVYTSCSIGGREVACYCDAQGISLSEVAFHPQVREWPILQGFQGLPSPSGCLGPVLAVGDIGGLLLVICGRGEADGDPQALLVDLGWGGDGGDGVTDLDEEARSPSPPELRIRQLRIVREARGEEELGRIASLGPRHALMLGVASSSVFLLELAGGFKRLYIRETGITADTGFRFCTQAFTLSPGVVLAFGRSQSEVSEQRDLEDRKNPNFQAGRSDPRDQSDHEGQGGGGDRGDRGGGDGRPESASRIRLMFFHLQLPGGDAAASRPGLSKSEQRGAQDAPPAQRHRVATRSTTRSEVSTVSKESSGRKGQEAPPARSFLPASGSSNYSLSGHSASSLTRNAMESPGELSNKTDDKSDERGRERAKLAGPAPPAGKPAGRRDLGVVNEQSGPERPERPEGAGKARPPAHGARPGSDGAVLNARDTSDASDVKGPAEPPAVALPASGEPADAPYAPSAPVAPSALAASYATQVWPYLIGGGAEAYSGESGDEDFLSSSTRMRDLATDSSSPTDKDSRAFAEGSPADEERPLGAEDGPRLEGNVVPGNFDGVRDSEGPEGRACRLGFVERPGNPGISDYPDPPCNVCHTFPMTRTEAPHAHYRPAGGAPARPILPGPGWAHTERRMTYDFPVPFRALSPRHGSTAIQSVSSVVDPPADGLGGRWARKWAGGTDTPSLTVGERVLAAFADSPEIQDCAASGASGASGTSGISGASGASDAKGATQAEGQPGARPAAEPAGTAREQTPEATGNPRSPLLPAGAKLRTGLVEVSIHDAPPDLIGSTILNSAIVFFGRFLLVCGGCFTLVSGSQARRGGHRGRREHFRSERMAIYDLVAGKQSRTRPGVFCPAGPGCRLALQGGVLYIYGSFSKDGRACFPCYALPIGALAIALTDSEVRSAFCEELRKRGIAHPSGLSPSSMRQALPYNRVALSLGHLL